MGPDGQAEVTIVGAGLSGLIAAKSLVEAGVTVQVVEARKRVGGRALATTLGGTVFDIGGQWIGPGQQRMAALCEELGIPVFPTWDRGKKVLQLGKRVVTYSGDVPRLSPLHVISLHRALKRLERFVREVPADDPTSARKAASWDGQTLETLARRLLRARSSRSLFEAAVRVVFGAETSELSALSFLAYASAAGGFRRLIDIRGGAQQDRLVGGAQQICERLAKGLGRNLALGCAARRINHGKGRVQVVTDYGIFHSRYAIIALPPALAVRIHYDPALPTERDQLLQRVPMGATIKCVATYGRPFWRQRGFSGELVSDNGPLTVTMDNTSYDERRPALVGFIVGEAARAWSGRPKMARQQAVLEQLSRVFGDEARNAANYVDKDWASDPWSRGCPVGVMGPGLLTRVGANLRTAVGRLHWAGTETATEWRGYMEGALQAGQRAAFEVAERVTKGTSGPVPILRPSSKESDD